MRPVKLVANSWAVLCAAATVAVIVARYLFPSLAATDPNQFTHLTVFLVGQAIVEVAAAIAVYGLALLIRSCWRDASGAAPAIVAAALVTTLAIPTYYLVRARGFFWSRLARDAFAVQQINQVDALASSGRPADALEAAMNASRTLTGTSYEGVLRTRTVVLERTIAVSRALAGNATTFRANVWNPVKARQTFYRLAEAVRLNPQNYEAAEVLRKLIDVLERTAFEADARALCAASAAAAQRGWSLSMLELEVLRLDPASCGTARQTLEKTWAIKQVRCILALSDATREPWMPAATAGAPLATVPACSAFH